MNVNHLLEMDINVGVQEPLHKHVHKEIVRVIQLQQPTINVKILEKVV